MCLSCSQRIIIPVIRGNHIELVPNKRGSTLPETIYMISTTHAANEPITVLIEWCTAVPAVLTQSGWNKISAIPQTTFTNAFSTIKIHFDSNFANICSKCPVDNNQNWFQYPIGLKQATNRRIYLSLDLDRLIQPARYCLKLIVNRWETGQ